MIYVVGDSHVGLFVGHEEFQTFHIGEPTAYNLVELKSTNQSFKKLNEAMDKMEKRSRVILCVGEIDCRIHIYYQYRKTGRSMEKLISATVERYVEICHYLRINNFIPVGCSIPPAGYEGNDYNYPYYAQSQMRAYIYDRFHKMQREWLYNVPEQCERYLDLYASTVHKESGLVLEHYTTDGVHLNQNAFKFVEEAMK
jgi:hypothetical protein